MTADPTGRATSGRDFLARLTESSQGRASTDRRGVTAGLVALGREALELVRGYASEDPVVRQAAHRRWAELEAMLPRRDRPLPPSKPGLGERDRVRLHAALTALVEDLRQATRNEDETPDDQG